MPHVPLRSASRSLWSGPVMTETRFRQAFLLLLVAAISAAFVAMIRAFLLTIPQVRRPIACAQVY
jgi:hypothetical protein